MPFLPATYSPDQVFLRASDSPRCIASAQVSTWRWDKKRKTDSNLIDSQIANRTWFKDSSLLTETDPLSKLFPSLLLTLARTTCMASISIFLLLWKLGSNSNFEILIIQSFPTGNWTSSSATRLSRSQLTSWSSTLPTWRLCWSSMLLLCLTSFLPSTLMILFWEPGTTTTSTVAKLTNCLGPRVREHSS